MAPPRLSTSALKVLISKKPDTVKNLPSPVVYEARKELESIARKELKPRLTRLWRNKHPQPLEETRTYRDASRMTIPAIKRQLKEILPDRDLFNNYPAFCTQFYKTALICATTLPNSPVYDNDGTILHRKLFATFVDNIKPASLRVFYCNWFITDLHSIEHVKYTDLVNQLNASVLKVETDIDAFIKHIFIHSSTSLNSSPYDTHGNILHDNLFDIFIDNLKPHALRGFYNNWFHTWNDMEDPRFLNDPRYFKPDFVVHATRAGIKTRRKRKPRRKPKSRSHH
tara:strand:- start:876 stop:1724 length:849 start_codon:yes stop_codon:yes gene_type:complete